MLTRRLLPRREQLLFNKYLPHINFAAGKGKLKYLAYESSFL